MEEDIGKMLDRILEKSKERLKLDAVVYKEGETYTIETEKEKVKERVKDHYEEWTRTRNVNINEIKNNEYWNEIYKPIEEINPAIYKELMKEIDIEELDEVIKKSKNKKAAGASGIP